MEPESFRALRQEMVDALSANFKETDLFKLYQTGDLANLDASDPEMVRKPLLPAIVFYMYTTHPSQMIHTLSPLAP